MFTSSFQILFSTILLCMLISTAANEDHMTDFSPTWESLDPSTLPRLKPTACIDIATNCEHLKEANLCNKENYVQIAKISDRMKMNIQLTIVVLLFLHLTPALLTKLHENEACKHAIEDIPAHIPPDAEPICQGDFEVYYELIRHDRNLCLLVCRLFLLISCVCITAHYNQAASTMPTPHCYDNFTNNYDMLLYPTIYVNDNTTHFVLQTMEKDKNFAIYDTLKGHTSVNYVVDTFPENAIILPCAKMVVGQYFVDLELLITTNKTQLMHVDSLNSTLPPAVFSDIKYNCWGSGLRCILDVTNVTENPTDKETLDVRLLFEESTAIYHEHGMTLLRICNQTQDQQCTYLIKDYISQRYFYIPWSLFTCNYDGWTTSYKPVARIPVLRTMSDQFKKRRNEVKLDPLRF
ncbi:hypothetical protein M3Y96_01007000 [Aphelenchoides besseyi]|nr:hypothetical protein M3Y96_01007000 [Aphelenchoides besseyi]